MIAPTNCNPDCDCAQRMVRCQRAAPPDPPHMTADELLAALEKEFPATMGVAPGHTDLMVTPESLDEFLEKNPPPPYVIPASLAPPDKGLGEPVRAFEDTFSAETVLMERFFPDKVEPPRDDTKHLQVSAKYPGAWGPMCLMMYDRTDLRCRLIKAFRACELDCGMWSDNALRELAEIAVATLEKSP